MQASTMNYEVRGTRGQLQPRRSMARAMVPRPRCPIRTTGMPGAPARVNQPNRSLITARAELTILTTPEEEEDFDKLGDAVGQISPSVVDELRGCSIYLVGMMGSGKSTLGKMLANTLKYTFFDTDFLIEKSHESMTCADVMKEYGQDYFRTAESQVMKELSPYKNLVISTGGGAVIKPMNWSYMQQGVVVWLNGDVELLARRVVAEGIAKRPLLAEGSSPEDLEDSDKMLEIAKTKLTAILEDRSKYYENADIVVPLGGTGDDAGNGAPSAVLLLRLLRALDEKMKATKAEREERRNFTIENADELKTMRAVQSPAFGEQNAEE